MKWRDLLQQCFNCYESGNYHITIPSLFSIVEGLAFELIKQEAKTEADRSKAEEELERAEKNYESVRSVDT